MHHLPFKSIILQRHSNILQNQINLVKSHHAQISVAPCTSLSERKFLSLSLLLKMFPAKGSRAVDCWALYSKEGRHTGIILVSMHTPKAKTAAGYSQAGQCQCSTCDYICTRVLPAPQNIVLLHK